MLDTIIRTKFFAPRFQQKSVRRNRLLRKLDEGLEKKLILISAPVGYGKTTLLSEWVSANKCATAWLSLDKDDSDPSRFLTYFIGALQTIIPDKGNELPSLFQSQHKPSIYAIMTTLINDITTIDEDFILILDDYHVVDSQSIDDGISFFINHLPERMHLVIATREDPRLPLAKLRACDQLTEIRAAELRFDLSEAALLLKVMEINISDDDVSSLEDKTEGWVAGLQLAAFSMQGRDAPEFIKSFTGSHHFILDYLVDEVLNRYAEDIRGFLLHTSILERMCGSLCDAIILDKKESGRNILEYLEKCNLFIVPLDNDRKWYRYHHLFCDFLRQRLNQSTQSDKGFKIRDLYIRASEWFEESGLEIEAFKYAATANDYDRAERLIEGKGMPLHFRGALAPVLIWLKSLPGEILNNKPCLQTTFASVLLATGQTTGVDQLLRVAENTLQKSEYSESNMDLIGRIAAIRATMALSMNRADETISHSKRALEYLHPDNHSFRTFTIWKLGFAYHLQGDRVAAQKAYTEALSASRATGNIITTLVTMMSIGNLQEEENNLYQAVETYKNIVQMIDDIPFPTAFEVYLGLARIYYKWNELEMSEKYAQQSIKLAEQVENKDKLEECKAFLAQIRNAAGKNNKKNSGNNYNSDIKEGIQTLAEPLSKRETEILMMIAQGLSNQEISERLYLSIITVKGHNSNIFGKLQVQRRTEAVARARDLGLL